MRMIYLLLLLSTIYCQTPNQFAIDGNQSSAASSDTYSNRLNSNHVINIEIFSDSVIFLGTTNGLNMASYNLEGYEFINDPNNNILGGNPALVVQDSIIAVSGVAAFSIAGGVENGGTGILYSIDSGESWNYILQPIDSSSYLDSEYTDQYACSWGNYDDSSLFSNKENCDENCFDCSGAQRSCVMYDYISWGDQDSILNFSVTTHIHNISYGLAVHGNYIYAASWAGSLRRFNFTIEQPSWEVVPLPMDNQYYLNSNEIDVSSFQVNPIGNYIAGEDCGYEFDNHKVFSVHAVQDTLWVGTAAGINKGIVSSDGLIDWSRLTSENNGFYDDWIIGFENQVLDDGLNRIWAITWDRRFDGSYLTYGGPPSYSDNGGYTWKIIDYLIDKKIITYNISTNENQCYVSTDQGLFLSNESTNMELWEQVILPNYIINQSVYDAEIIDESGDLWIASSPLSIISENSINYTSSAGNIEDIFYAYPNPFMIDEDEHITFSYNGDEGNINGIIDIYDFNMDKVISIDPLEITSWNGKNHFGHQVANGVYICEYVHSDNSKSYFNVMVINSR